MVAPQKSSQKVKDIVQKIKTETTLTKEHKTVYRPWGTYTILEDNAGYKIKKIEVKTQENGYLYKNIFIEMSIGLFLVVRQQYK